MGKKDNLLGQISPFHITPRFLLLYCFPLCFILPVSLVGEHYRTWGGDGEGCSETRTGAELWQEEFISQITRPEVRPLISFIWLTLTHLLSLSICCLLILAYVCWPAFLSLSKSYFCVLLMFSSFDYVRKYIKLLLRIKEDHTKHMNKSSIAFVFLVR